MVNVALFGAAGKMGTRISEKLRLEPDYAMAYVEAGPAAEQRLRERGLEPTPPEEAVRDADAVILAVPDVYIGAVARQIVPLLKPGAMVICLDPAAPYSGELPERADITYFITHPCHPSIANKDLPREALEDYFGGVAPQALVCTLMQGPEVDYARGETLCRRMFEPVSRTHRVTVEQMALLEPAMAETVALTCMTVIREAVDEVIARGVPEDAAMDFMLGHLNVNVGILFGLIDAVVSDGARLAVERARQTLFQPDWKKVFETENVIAEVKSITAGTARG
jgi:D-apionate oxidoisomerase